MHEYLERATKNLTLDELTVFAMKWRKAHRKVHIARIIWLFTFFIGGHRFYLGDNKTGILMIIVTLITAGVGMLWGIIDFLNIQRVTDSQNEKIALKLVKEVKRK